MLDLAELKMNAEFALQSRRCAVPTSQFDYGAIDREHAILGKRDYSIVLKGANERVCFS